MNKKTLYRYEYGNPSWHQRKAGNWVSGVLVTEHTPEEHELFMARAKARNDVPIPVTARSGRCPHCGPSMTLVFAVGGVKSWKCEKCNATYSFNET